MIVVGCSTTPQVEKKFQDGIAYYWRTSFVFFIFIDDNLISPYIYRNLTVATVVSNSSELKQVCYKMYFITMPNIVMTVNIVIQTQDLTDTDCVELLYQLLQK